MRIFDTYIYTYSDCAGGPLRMSWRYKGKWVDLGTGNWKNMIVKLWWLAFDRNKLVSGKILRPEKEKA